MVSGPTPSACAVMPTEVVRIAAAASVAMARSRLGASVPVVASFMIPSPQPAVVWWQWRSQASLYARLRRWASSGVRSSARKEGNEQRHHLIARLVHQPMTGAFDDDAFDIVIDQAALIDEKLSTGLFARQHQHRHRQLGFGKIGKILAV